MPANVKQQGHYELFETNHHHRILVLNDEQWYAWVQGQQSEILVHSDSDHEKDHTIQEGDFRLVEFQDDPRFKDMPHLFLEHEDHYDELMLPNGLPTESDHQKNLVPTDETLDKQDLEQYLQHPRSAGEGETRQENRGEQMGQTPDLPIQNYNDLTVEEIQDRLNVLNADQIRKLKAYEQKHKHRKTLMEAYDRKLD